MFKTFVLALRIEACSYCVVLHRRTSNQFVSVPVGSYLIVVYSYWFVVHSHWDSPPVCCDSVRGNTMRNDRIVVLVHGPEQILVPSGWAKLGNVFRVHICPVHYLSHDRPLNSAAFMWLSPMLIILFPKNSIFVFFNDFQIIFKLKRSSMIVLIKYNCSNTSWYPFRLYLSISLKKGSNCDKFMQKFLPFHNQWKIWTASLHLILRL